MFKTDAQTEFAQTIKEFSAVTYERYGSHSYASGYYESLMTEMFRSLSKRSQQQLIRDIASAVERQHGVLVDTTSV